MNEEPFCPGAGIFDETFSGRCLLWIVPHKISNKDVGIEADHFMDSFAPAIIDCSISSSVTARCPGLCMKP